MSVRFGTLRHFPKPGFAADAEQVFPIFGTLPLRVVQDASLLRCRAAEMIPGSAPRLSSVARIQGVNQVLLVPRFKAESVNQGDYVSVLRNFDHGSFSSICYYSE